MVRQKLLASGAITVFVGLFAVFGFAGPSQVAPKDPRNVETELVDPHILHWIQALKKHPLKLIRKNAARQLGALGDPAGIPPLTDALKDEFHDVRKEASRSLGLIGGEESLAPLILLSKRDSDIQVRRLAREAVERIKARQEYRQKKEEKRIKK